MVYIDDIDTHKQENVKMVGVMMAARHEAIRIQDHHKVPHKARQGFNTTSSCQAIIDSIDQYFMDLEARIDSDIENGIITESNPVQALRKIKDIGTGTTMCGDGDEDNCSHCMSVEDIVDKALEGIDNG